MRFRAPHLSTAEHLMLAHALETQDPLYLEYVNAQGGYSERIVERPRW